MFAQGSPEFKKCRGKCQSRIPCRAAFCSAAFRKMRSEICSKIRVDGMHVFGRSVPERADTSVARTYQLRTKLARQSIGSGACDAGAQTMKDNNEWNPCQSRDVPSLSHPHPLSTVLMRRQRGGIKATPFASSGHWPCLFRPSSFSTCFPKSDAPANKAPTSKIMFRKQFTRAPSLFSPCPTYPQTVQSTVRSCQTACASFKYRHNTTTKNSHQRPVRSPHEALTQSMQL